MQVSGNPEFHRLVIGTEDVDDCGVNSPDLACSDHPYPRGPALIVEPVGVTNAPTYQLWVSTLLHGGNPTSHGADGRT